MFIYLFIYFVFTCTFTFTFYLFYSFVWYFDIFFLFPNRFVTFIAGSFVAVITVLSLYDEQFLLDVHVAGGRSMLWILGLFGIVLAVSRSLIPDDNLVFDPVMLMKNIVYHTHMFPATWKGREHTYEVFIIYFGFLDNFFFFFFIIFFFLFINFFSFL